MQFVVFEKIHKCLFIPNCTRRSKVRASSSKIIYSNLCVQSKRPRTIKTIICNDIFTSLRRQKIQSPAKQCKQLSVSFVTSLHWINSLLQGIVLSSLLLLCTELTLVCMELPENYICLNQSELSKFFMYLINHLMRYMKKITQRSPIAVTRSSNYFYLDHLSTFSISIKKFLC